MTDTQKQLYLQIKNKIDSGDFSRAVELCEDYVLSYPSSVEGWLSYVLAFCEVKNTKALAECEIDFTQTDIFQKALDNLGEGDRSKFVSLAETISSARSKKAERNVGYNDGLQYFVSNIKEVKQNIINVKVDLKTSLDEDAANFKSSKKAIVFFSNNIFVFFLTAVLLMIPFLILYLYFDFAKMPEFFKTIALSVGGIVILIIVITKYIKQRKSEKVLKQQAENIIINEQRIVLLKNELAELKVKYKKLMKIYKFYKRHTRLSERGIAKLRTKFDSVYNCSE